MLLLQLSKPPDPDTGTPATDSKDPSSRTTEENAGKEEGHDTEAGPLVDMETFGQLLEMDDDEEHSFSKSLTWDYFDQVSPQEYGSVR